MVKGFVGEATEAGATKSLEQTVLHRGCASTIRNGSSYSRSVASRACASDRRQVGRDFFDRHPAEAADINSELVRHLMESGSDNVIRPSEVQHVVAAEHARVQQVHS